MRLGWVQLSVISFIILLLLPLGHAVEDANAIVAKADEIRVPSGSYILEAIITNFDGEKKKGKNGYKVYVKDLDNSLIEFKYPNTEVGKSMLMLQDDVWVYLPRVRKPVRVPLKQRLMGEVAIGDMTRANYSHDYNATLVGEEEVEGTLSYVLDLKAKSSKKTYERIKYWVAKADYRPVQAEYFTASGKSLKTVKFQEFTMVEGKMRPMQALYEDNINKNKKSYLRFNNMTKKKLRDMMFTKQYMKTLE